MKFKITYKSHDPKFIEKLEEIAGTDVHKCMQCGTCSGGCPMVNEMDVSPRQAMLLAHLGLWEQLDEKNTVWLCASCNTCFVRCPRGLDIPKIMEALRQHKLRDNVNHIEPNEISKEVLRKMPTIAMVSCFRKHTS